ncbi:sensor histidine kinase [Citricoccus sp. GCM10030269]|uniref:sensor histidine kinase n=1 Tax=Citricoccus sp. GCM10030269 TaxID=3273388 RepID=UPI003623BE0C
MLRWIRRPGWYAAGTTVAALLIGVLAFVVVRGSMLPEDPTSVPDPEALRITLLLFGDLFVGLLAVGLLPLALRPWAEAAPTRASDSATPASGWVNGWAFAAGMVVAATTVVSSLAMPAAVVVLTSFAARRRPWWFGVATGAFLVATAVNGFVVEPSPEVPTWPVVLLALAVPAICGLVGAVRRHRRALIRSLHQEAAAAHREREAHADQVRAAERTRIAREMHDSLSHRLSLISVHAGGLEYRSDLDEETLHRTAGLVRETARTAAEELRAVLSVLREEHHSTSPDATLAALGELVTTARDSGTSVELVTAGVLEESRTEHLPEVLSRAIYRFVQECLTNARTHAPRAPVHLFLGGGPGEGIIMRASNPLPADPPSPGPGGYGLIGLRERFELLDGRLEHRAAEGTFTVEAWVPWPS